MHQPPAIIGQLLSLIENEPGRTCQELALLGNLNWYRTKQVLSRLVTTDRLIRRYSAESLEQIFFVPGETCCDYHPLTLSEARKQRARFQARVNHYIATKLGR